MAIISPIASHLTRLIHQPPREICAQLLDTDRWPEFTGYSILPGIASAFPLCVLRFLRG